MKKLNKILALVLAITLVMSLFSSCSKKVESTPVKIDDFRVTAYLLGDRLLEDDFDASHLDMVTDIILFGNATFDESGNVALTDNFEDVLTKLQVEINADPNKKIYLNILGPDSQTDSDDWNDQMQDKADRHNKAFESKKLETNIKNILDEYKFDGVFFDYEFPIKSKNWKIFSDFLVSLDTTIDTEKTIGMSIVGWDCKLSDEAKEVVDMIEIMSYDLWDDDGNHATMDIAKDDVEKLVKKGFDKAKMDLGVPFYARPTTGESYWYDYKNYADVIDKNGLYDDKETGLTFSFNTFNVIKEKTAYAINEGLGGMMMWHYSCDLPADNSKSLFNAMNEAISEAKENATK